MQTYETLFITTPTLTEEEEKTTVETLSEIVTQGGGSMVVNERMGRRRLAYPIQKHNDGVYIRFLYDSEAAVPKELERRIRLSDRILRVLTVRLEGKRATVTKEQAIRDAQARVEAAERELVEAAEREALEAAAKEKAAAAGASEEGDDDLVAESVTAKTEETPVADADAKPAADADSSGDGKEG